MPTTYYWEKGYKNIYIIWFYFFCELKLHSLHVCISFAKNDNLLHWGKNRWYKKGATRWKLSWYMLTFRIQNYKIYENMKKNNIYIINVYRLKENINFIDDKLRQFLLEFLLLRLYCFCRKITYTEGKIMSLWYEITLEDLCLQIPMMSTYWTLFMGRTLRWKIFLSYLIFARDIWGSSSYPPKRMEELKLRKIN